MATTNWMKGKFFAASYIYCFLTVVAYIQVPTLPPDFWLPKVIHVPARTEFEDDCWYESDDACWYWSYDI